LAGCRRIAPTSDEQAQKTNTRTDAEGFNQASTLLNCTGLVPRPCRIAIVKWLGAKLGNKFTAINSSLK
jgi:hypothetical protein